MKTEGKIFKQRDGLFSHKRIHSRKSGNQKVNNDDEEMINQVRTSVIRSLSFFLISLTFLCVCVFNACGILNVQKKVFFYLSIFIDFTF